MALSRRWRPVLGEGGLLDQPVLHEIGHGVVGQHGVAHGQHGVVVARGEDGLPYFAGLGDRLLPLLAAPVGRPADGGQIELGGIEDGVMHGGADVEVARSSWARRI